MMKDRTHSFRWMKRLTAGLFLLLLTTALWSICGAAASVTQTGMTENTISISWSAPSITGTINNYKVYIRETADYQANAKLYKQVSAGTTSMKITDLKPGTEYNIEVKYDYTSSYGRSYEYSVGRLYDARTKVARVTGLKEDQWWYFLHVLDVSWDKQDAADGYEYVCKKSNGKKHAAALISGRSNAVSIKNINNEMIYTVQVRAFQDVNGQRVYGAWSDKITCFTQPRVTSVKVSSGKLKVGWKKVSGATGYAVYVSTKPKTGYKKVKKVSGSKSSVTINKIGGKKFKAGKRYYVYVQTLKKVKGKMNTSGKLYYWDSKSTNYGYLD